MNLKFEIALLFIGGILRILVIGADIWYLLSQSIQTSTLKYVAIISLIAPTAVMLLMYSVILIIDWVKNEVSSARIQIILFFIIGDSIGLNYFVFSFILCNSEILSGDFYVVDSMFRSTALVNSLFQSMPQIVYQAYNNQIVSNWGVFTIFSIGISTVSMFYTIYKLVYAIDKVKQFDKIMSLNPETQRTEKNTKSTEMNIPKSTENRNEDEHYLSSL